MSRTHVLWTLRGNAYLSMERYDDAIITCERAARIKGFEAEALILQAKAEVQREHYPEAVRLLEAAQTFKDQPHIVRYLEQLRRMVE